MIVLGVSGGFGHEAAAALVVDGRCVAMVEEERLSRTKHAEGEPARRSMRWCLAAHGLRPEQVDHLALGWDPTRDPTALQLEKAAAEVAADPVWRGRPPATTAVPHHIAHAASALWPSGFAECAVVVADGNGEDVATSTWRGSSHGLEVLSSMPSTQSLGHLYNAAVEFVGLARHGAGKLMGLASYGQATEEDLPAVEVAEDGYHLAIPDVESLPSPERFIELRRHWRGYLSRRFGDPVGAAEWSATQPGEVPRRAADVAAAVQSALVAALTSVVASAVTRTGNRRVALAGGVALNCSANGALLRSGLVDELFVVPPAHDAGTALGAALWLSNELSVAPAPEPAGFSPFLGPAADPERALGSARETGLTARRLPDIASAVADRLARGEVVGWVQGCAEVGPRALGGRSILAAPSSTAVRDRVNRGKGRELWRPLSPSLTVAESRRLLRDHRSPYMLLAVPVPDDLAEQMPATVHVDRTCRPQTVDEASADAQYGALLTELADRTGFGGVLNTSFNLAGEPMVCSADDALSTFVRSDLDAVAVGDVLVTR